MTNGRNNPGCLMQILWFALIGWWAGQLWISVAWLLMVTVIGIPFGVVMLNHLPKVIALRDPGGMSLAVTYIDNRPYLVPTTVHQHNILLRALYFVFVGWWLSGLWMEAAYAVSLTIIGLPIGFWMFDRVPAIVSLRR